MMRSDWRELQKEGVKGEWAQLGVSLNPRGDLVLSRRTWERVGAPKAFLVFFDTVNSRIGLKPTAEGIKNAYPCRARNGSSGPKRLAVYKLLVDFKINVPETIEFYNPDIDEDGVLVLELRTARISNRAKGRKASSAGKAAGI